MKKLYFILFLLNTSILISDSHLIHLTNKSGKPVKIRYFYNFYFYHIYGVCNFVKYGEYTLKNKKIFAAITSTCTYSPDSSMSKTFFWKPGNYKLILITIDDKIRIIVKNEYGFPNNFPEEFHFCENNQSCCFEILDLNQEGQGITLKKIKFNENLYNRHSCIIL